MKISSYIPALLMLLTGCEKVIEPDLETNEPSLVIEGNITNQPGPHYVKLTKTVNFDASSIYPVVNNALVIITDNAGQRDTLTYTTNGNYRTNTLQGITGRTYNLTVISEGKTYTAQSTMPQNVIFDSLRYNPFQFGGSTQHTVIPVYTDPVTLGNSYRFVLKVNGMLDKSYLVDNDNVNNGQVNQRPLRSADIEIEEGNIVQVEMQCIDANSYIYYFTLAQVQGNGPGGGTTPGNAPNGITGGALGLFSAFTTQTKSILIP
jgi:Domain of unknown function (DUF4249)